MEKPLVNTQRRERAKVRADVVPSPVGVAMVKVVKPSPPTPIPAQEGPFLTKIEVCITRAARLSRETFCECIIAVWCKPSSTFNARARALSKSLTFTMGSIGISCSHVTQLSSASTTAISRRGAFAGKGRLAASSKADGLFPTSFCWRYRLAGKLHAISPFVHG